jgi:peptidoglycan/xylan/chitin deacetylase (PgdA/CDA1 family)
VPAVSHDDLLHGPRTVAAVALTFHGAGAPELTRAALSIAHREGARFTVMAVGKWLDQNPALARAILDGGHELGNHTWSHQTMPKLDAATTRSEILQGAEVLTRLTGSHGRWFRPSGTPRSTPLIRAAALAAGYQRCLSYDVDSLDYTDPGAAAVRAKVHKEARGGSIVSLHLGHPGTIQALPAILSDLKARGLSAVTVSDLVGGAA